jgi:hypothetical protein
MRRLARSAAIAALTLVVSHCHRLSSAEAPSVSPPLHVAAPWNSPEALSTAPTPPVTLTASDGTGLELKTLAARAVLEGPLAFTELHLAFVNPQPRVLEGTFKIALPQSASLSRFAMRIDDRWQEGEVVERQRARVAYEDFLHRKRDPALLEQSAGNEFSARVFPIAPNATKEVLVSYAEELRGATPYALALRGLPKLGAIQVSVAASESNSPLATLRETDWTPTSDLVVDRASLAQGDGLRSGDLVVARVRPMTETRPDPLGPTLVLFDTSASRALGFEAQAHALQELAARLADAAGDATWTLACFDQSVEEIYSGPLRGLAAAAMDRIRARGPLGASDLSRALAWARRRVQETGAKRVLVVSDGVATAGEVDRASLAAAARALGTVGIERIDALAVGGIRDDALLHAIAASGLKRDGIVVGADQSATTVARRLGEATSSGMAVRVDGARWWYPQKIDGVQFGDEFLVYAEVPDSATVGLGVGGGPTLPVHLRPVERPLIERAWAQAKIASLLDAHDADADAAAIHKQVVDLSTKHRVASPFTALLVLETEGDYARFGIDRKALADILSVQGSRVALVHRKDALFAPTPLATAAARPFDEKAAQFGMIGLLSGAASADPNAPTAPWGRNEAPSAGSEGSMHPQAADLEVARGDSVHDSFGAGGLGLSGVGEGGGSRGEGIGLGNLGGLGHGAGTGTGQGIGNGHGRLGGGHTVMAPRIREGATSVNGRLPPEVIQRIVRQNFGRFRLCYENGLRNRPTLQGRVTVRFVIDGSGAVPMTADAGSDLPDQGVVQCVVRAFGVLSFPAPSGGMVTVVYPITFTPGDSNGSDADARVAPQPIASPRPTEPPLTPTAAVPAAGPYAGGFADVMRALDSRDVAHALQIAWGLRAHDPGDVMALVALGEALEASGDKAAAARAYGSIIDLFPSRADMRRMAGERLERVARMPDRGEGAGADVTVSGGDALGLAADTYAKAVEQRPDHPSGHRLLAYARLAQHDYQRAFDAAVAALAHPYPGGRFPGVDRVLREDLGLIGAAWAAAEPKQRDAIAARVQAAGGRLEMEPSLRFVLNWETDANDVDLHVRDGAGDHAFYSHPSLASGGELYADVTTGYGPECFTVRLSKGAKRSRYALQVHYYARGPMGYGMGKMEVIDHDGHGGLTFSERPFVVMNDQAFVELGSY